MKKLLVLVLALTCLISAAAAAFAEADFHIGIMTATVSQAEDDMRGAEGLIERYGDVANGGMIRHITFPDNFTTEIETTISQLVGLADDPKMKAIVVVNGPEGTTEAFRRIKEKRSDILLMVAAALEDPAVIAPVADVCVDVDFIRFGYLIIASVKKMGADTFMHISFPRHMSYEVISRRAAVMREACKEMGLEFVLETAPDPTTDVGVAGTQQYLLEKVPAWFEKYGKNTALFSTNSAHHEPMIKRIVDNKAGYYSFGDMPSPIKGFPGALNVDLTAEKGNWPAIVNKIEKAAVEKGVGGRLGTWKYSVAFMHGLGLGEFAKRVVEGEAKITSGKDLVAAYEAYTPGTKWNIDTYVEAATQRRLRNFFTIWQAPYVLGSGYVDLSDVTVPDWVNSVK